MNTAMLQNPAIKDPRFACLRARRRRTGQVTRREGGHKRRECVTEVGRNQDYQPELGHMATPAGQVEGQQTERHQGIAKEVGNFQGHAQQAAGSAGGVGHPRHQPVIECQQPLLQVVVRSLEELAGLPVRHQEKTHGKPVAQYGNIAQRKKKRRCPRQRHGYQRDERQKNNV